MNTHGVSGKCASATRLNLNKAAIASFFIDYRFRGPDGEVTEEQAFETEVWQKMDDAWKVVGLHNNVIPLE